MTTRSLSSSYALTRVERTYLGFQFFFPLLVWLPVFFEFQKRLGLSEGQIFEIQTIYYFAFCIFELPTGYLADRWGRVRAMRWASIILVLAHISVVFWHTAAGFLFHFVSVGFARSLVSGAASAYLYDCLSRMGQLDRYAAIEGRARALGLLGKVVCWPFAGALLARHLMLPYWITAGFAAFSAFIAYRIQEEPRTHKGASDPFGFLHFLSTFCRAIRGRIHDRSGSVFGWVVLQGTGVFALGRLAQVNLFQPILAHKGFTLPYFGGLLAAMTLLEAWGSSIRPFSVEHGQNGSNTRKVFFKLILWTVGISIGMSLLGIVGPVLSVVLFCIISFGFGVYAPLQRSLINAVIPDARYRASWLSVESMVDRIASAGLNALAGFFIARGMLPMGLHAVAGVIILINGMAYLRGSKWTD